MADSDEELLKDLAESLEKEEAADIKKAAEKAKERKNG